jgi:acyl carrier protein
MKTQNTGIDNKQVESLTSSNIEDWLVAYLAELLDIEPEMVDIQTPFANYGLDSAAAVVMVGDIENWLNQKLRESLLFDYPTIEKVAAYLAK